MAYNFDGTPRVPYPKHAPGRVRAGGFGKFTGGGYVSDAIRIAQQDANERKQRRVGLQGKGAFKRDGVQKLQGAGRRRVRGGNTPLLEEIARQLKGGAKLAAARRGIGKASRVHPDSYFGPKLTR